MPKMALIVVDVQRDFCEGGALAASDTLSLLEPLKNYIESARRAGAVIVFTKDWHPETHSSFQNNAGPWPVHCVAGSPGAELMPPLADEEGDVIVQKGMDVNGAGYSGFEGTGLNRKLRELGVQSVAITGIATEYCVRATALDAVRARFETAVLTDLIRAVQMNETEKVLSELNAAGIKTIHGAQWLAPAGEAKSSGAHGC
ncbi:MAG TPA: isochorismatase family protein [Methylomirabilota bacterium]|nr:isochorismatase family protein [Methylomirabilota bacterium]